MGLQCFAFLGLFGAGLLSLNLARLQAAAPLALAGPVFLGLSLFLARRWALLESAGDGRFLFRAALLWGLLLYGVLAFWQESAVIQGRRCFWLEDDAMVSMRYAARWAAGLGLTWTKGPRVEGYSDFLWTALMALIHWLGASRLLASGWILLVDALCLLWLAQATRRLSLGLGAGALGAALAGLACALSYDLLAGALSGLEMAAVAAVAAQALAWGVEAERAGKPWPWTAFALAGLLPLLRADGGLPALLLLLLGLRWAGNRERGLGLKRCLLAGLLALGPGVAHELFRHAYYGAWVPNTYTLKAGAWPGKYQGGAAKLARDLGRYPLVLLSALGALGVRAWRPFWAVLAALALYCVWTGADYYPYLRFFAPAFALLFALGFASAERLATGFLAPWRGRRGARTSRITRVWVPAALLVFSANAAWGLPYLVQGGWQGARERAELGLMLKQRIPPNQSLAGAWAGAFFYFSGLPGVDLLGKNDAVVAAAKPDPSLGGVGHNKLDLDYSLGVLKPDWILLKAPSYSPADQAYLVSPYDQRIASDPRFLAHCMPHMVQISDHWALCHCEWRK